MEAGTVTAGTPRSFIEERVAERAERLTVEQVQETCSFAQAERLLGREYHGRFLIELLQNGADAWRDDGRPGRSHARIVVTDGPCLLVGNQGSPFPATAVIESLGHIGRSTKAHGEAIGHKGIGFKSVLEISLVPELYSGLQEPGAGVAVRFDPRVALNMIRARSPEFDAHLKADGVEPLKAVPVLRYPTWAEDLPDDVKAFADDRFDTVVRLPFDDEVRPDPEMDGGAWSRAVARALSELSDEMLLLLGTFDRLEVIDQTARAPRVVKPDWGGARPLDSAATREEVTVLHNDTPASRWSLYRKTLPDTENLSGEIAVGLRRDLENEALVAASDGAPASPFHLFFPTRIGAGLPFLLHGYFEVNAARTGFYDGSAERNGMILDEIAELLALAIADLASDEPTAVLPLADLLGETVPPENARAAEFRDLVLSLLDDVPWVSLEPGHQVPVLAKPTAVLVDESPDLIDRTVAAFDAGYILQRTGRAVPSRTIGPLGHAYLVNRSSDDDDLWDAMSVLTRPGETGAWAEGEEGSRFRAFLDLIGALVREDAAQADDLLSGLRGDPDAYLLPVGTTSGGQSVVAVPDVEGGVAGRRSQLVMARTRAFEGGPLDPPPAMDVAFLPDGLLDSERLVDSAKPLGVRDFTVDNVLDRLRGSTAVDADPAAMLRFLWALLTREARSEFSVASAIERAADFDPSEWFWCRPGHGARIGPDRDRQARRRLLSEVHLPSRDGHWRPATTLAFGADWADWIAAEDLGEQTEAAEARVSAYRALDVVRPSDAAMLASPQELLSVVTGAVEPADNRQAHIERNVALHGFLLTLGVWETLPVEGFESREPRNRERFPWSGPAQDARTARVDARGGWQFIRHKWAGGPHQRVWVAEDFRFRWSLDECAARDAALVAALVSIGTPLYTRLRRAAAFCPNCTSSGVGHQKRYSSSPEDEYPSVLAIELQEATWVPTRLNGELLEHPQAAETVWWSERVPTGAALVQSPLRFLPLWDPAIELSGDLRELARISDLDHASIDRLQGLLAGLRSGMETGTLPVELKSSNAARQSFSGLHRRIYDRLEELSAEDAESVEQLITDLGVLCDLGDALRYAPADEARHDDGQFASYRRYFSGRVPFAQLSRDRASVASALGVASFRVEEERRPTEDARDVTDEVSDFLADRAPELLAIVAHHSLGTQTLEPGSQQFEERATRLRNLRVYQVDDLIIDVQVEGIDATATIGEGSDQDLFLEGSSSPHPVLFHDLVGEGWKDALRRKLAPSLAQLLENPAYSATFALFLLAEGDGEREEALHDLGIAPEDVNAIRGGLGALSEEEQALQRRWFGAIVGALNESDPAELRDEDFADAIAAVGMPAEVAGALVEFGGSEAVRGNGDPDGPLWLLDANGVELSDVDSHLRALDASDGLSVNVPQRLLSSWSRLNRRRVAAALSTVNTAEDAKAAPDSWKAPDEIRFTLDPEPSEWLRPVIASLRECGWEPDATSLASAAGDELARVAGLDGVEALDTAAARLYDPEESARMLRAEAAAWRDELALLGVLTRAQRGDSRSAIRAHAATVDELLPTLPRSPSELRAPLEAVFASHEAFVTAVAEKLTDVLGAVPDRGSIVALAERHRLDTGLLDLVLRALDEPKRDLARRVRSHMKTLESNALRPRPVAGIKPPDRDHKPPGDKPKRVPTVKVSPTTDARKRRVGDDGERWALAAVLRELTKLAPSQRRTAIEEITALLERFEGTPVEKARAHAEPACEPELEDDELIDELTELLHVSRHSDGFGFDLLGWLPPDGEGEPIAICLEVKSTRTGTFHLSRSEWKRAQAFHDEGDGNRYAVLVVQRGTGSDPPRRFDLLVDPFHLVDSGQIAKDDDGYQLSYKAG